MSLVSTQINGKFRYFIRNDYPLLVQKVKQFVNSPEPGVIISPPLNGTVYRIEQLIQDDASEFAHPLVQIDLGANIEDIAGVETYIKSQGYSTQQKLILLITNCDYCLRSKGAHLLRTIAKWQYEGCWKVVFLFESDITSETNRDLLGSTHFYAQEFYYPHFDSLESTRFVHYLAKSWDMPKLTKSKAHKIVSMCGGQMWLLKHIMREYHTNAKLDFDRLAELPGTEFRLNLISQALTGTEIAVLSGQLTDTSTQRYLERVGLFANGKCTVPLLRDYIQRIIFSKKLVVKNREIFCNDVNLRHSFSPQENNVLCLLIKQKGHGVSRDAIADALWGDDVEEKYSVWAIEQLIKRLRLKLKEIGLPDSYIKTFHKIGYGII